MKRHVRKVAVLGSGVMGSAIAAHFANAGVPSLVLDIVPKEPNEAEKASGLTLEDRAVRDRFAADSVKALLKAKPAPLFTPDRLALIEVGNLEDDLPRLEEADWVLEVVKEDLEIKKKVLAAAAPHIGPEAVLSSNTSGLSVTQLASVLPSVRVVDPHQIARFQQENPFWNTLPHSDLIKRLGVDRVIYIDLVQYALHEPGNAYIKQGKLELYLHVMFEWYALPCF